MPRGHIYARAGFNRSGARDSPTHRCSAIEILRALGRFSRGCARVCIPLYSRMFVFICKSELFSWADNARRKLLDWPPVAFEKASF